MTLKTRNQVNLVLIFFTFLVIIATCVLFVVRYVNSDIMISAEVFLQNVIEKSPVLAKSTHTYSMRIVILSVFTLAFMALILLVYIKIEFEKTQSTEVVYFLFFAVACLVEVARLAFPIFSLWDNRSGLAFTSTKIVMAARIFCPLSLLFASLYNKAEQRQYTEQNILVLFVVSIYFAFIYPLNTQKVLPLCYLEVAFPKLFTFACYAVFVLTILTQIVDYTKDNTKYSFPYGLTLLCTGYMFLCKSLTIIQYVLGTIFFAAGSLLYLKDLHKQYMWV